MGSNVGDRGSNLRLGVRQVSRLLDPITVSGVYETAPRHVAEQPDFLNACCTGWTRLSALQLLLELKHIETLAGRSGGRRYGPRPLDLDILLYGEGVIDRPELIVPHPRMHERAFVLLPLREIAADWKVPSAGGGQGETVAQLAAAVSHEGVIRTNLKLEGG